MIASMRYILLVPIICATVAYAEDAATLLSSKGSVTARTNEKKNFEIVTGKRAKAQARLRDGTLVTVGPNTSLEVGENGEVTLAKGVIRVLSNAPKSVATGSAAVSLAQGMLTVAAVGKRTYVGLFKSSGSIQNQGGTLSLGATQKYDFAFVLSSNEAPQGQISEPAFLAAIDEDTQTDDSPLQLPRQYLDLAGSFIMTPLTVHQREKIWEKVSKHGEFHDWDLIRLGHPENWLQMQGLYCR